MSRKTNKCVGCGLSCDFRRNRCAPCATAIRKICPSDRLAAMTVRRESGCHEFTGFRLPKGYGRIDGGQGVPVLAHRLAWTINFGDIPTGLLVCHKCDNPPCVNPDHLFLGTGTDNALDMVAKGRVNPPKCQPKTRAENHWKNKLSTAQVMQILARKNEPRERVAKDFGVRRQYISAIICGTKWKHISREVA